MESRQHAAARLTDALSRLPGLHPPQVSAEATHVYYVYGITLDLKQLSCDRALIINALKAEGVTGLLEGYQNIHLNPLFRHRIAYGTSGFPWTGLRSGTARFVMAQVFAQWQSTCINVFIGLNLCAHAFTDDQVDAVIEAFEKVWAVLSKSASR